MKRREDGQERLVPFLCDSGKPWGRGGGGEGQYVRAGAGSKGSLLRLSRTAAESRNPETGAPRFSSQLRDTSLDLSLSVFSTVK